MDNRRARARMVLVFLLIISGILFAMGVTIERAGERQHSEAVTERPAREGLKLAIPRTKSNVNAAPPKAHGVGSSVLARSRPGRLSPSSSSRYCWPWQSGCGLPPLPSCLP